MGSPLSAPETIPERVMTLMPALQSLVFPGQATQGRPEARVHPPPGCELVSLRTADGVEVAALFGRATVAEAAARPTVLFLYGNAMCLATALGLVAFWNALGANVLVPEYPGYGLSAGRASEAGCYAAADAALAQLAARPDVDPARVVAAGLSLGGGVAIDLASRAPVAGLIGLATFTNLGDVVRKFVPFPPAALLLRGLFPSDRKIGRVRCPILLVHGTRDSIVPHDLMPRLAAAARVPVTQLSIPGADHNDLFLVGRVRIAAALKEFLGRV